MVLKGLMTKEALNSAVANRVEQKARPGSTVRKIIQPSGEVVRYFIQGVNPVHNERRLPKISE